MNTVAYIFSLINFLLFFQASNLEDIKIKLQILYL